MGDVGKKTQRRFLLDVVLISKLNAIQNCSLYPLFLLMVKKSAMPGILNI